MLALFRHYFFQRNTSGCPFIVKMLSSASRIAISRASSRVCTTLLLQREFTECFYRLFRLLRPVLQIWQNSFLLVVWERTLSSVSRRTTKNMSSTTRVNHLRCPEESSPPVCLSRYTVATTNYPPPPPSTDGCELFFYLI